MKWIALALPSIFVVTLAHAASFDCVKARTKMEKMICGDAELSKLDEDLGRSYQKAVQREDVKKGAIESQRNWLKLERNVCVDVPCLKQAYQKRIKELGITSSFGIVLTRMPPGTQPPIAASSTIAPASATAPPAASIAPPPPYPKQSPHPAVCYAVVDAANQGKLSELAFELPEDGLVDINGDGKKERVVVVDEGTMHWQHFEAFSESGKPIELRKSTEDDWESENLGFALDPSLIKYNGKIYILGKTDDYLHYLSQVNTGNVEKVVCEFAQRNTPVETLITSKNDKLCQLALKQQLDYVDFDQASELTYEAIRDTGVFPDASTTPTDMAAQVDINNDGKPELVVGLEMMSGGGRGCNMEQLGVLNRERDNLDMTITQQLPESECGGIKQNPFIFEGQTYIEIMYPSEHPINVHKVVQLKQGKLDTVCQFDVRLVNYVKGE